MAWRAFGTSALRKLMRCKSTNSLISVENSGASSRSSAMRSTNSGRAIGSGAWACHGSRYRRGLARAAIVAATRNPLSGARTPVCGRRSRLAAVPAIVLLAGAQQVRFDPNRVWEAWLLQPVAGIRPFPLIIYTHGNDEQQPSKACAGAYRARPHGPSAWWCRAAMTDAGVAVLLAEYPGYGRSDCRPTATPSLPQ